MVIIRVIIRLRLANSAISRNNLFFLVFFPLFKADRSVFPTISLRISYHWRSVFPTSPAPYFLPPLCPIAPYFLPLCSVFPTSTLCISYHFAPYFLPLYGRPLRISCQSAGQLLRISYHFGCLLITKKSPDWPDWLFGAPYFLPLWSDQGRTQVDGFLRTTWRMSFSMR